MSLEVFPVLDSELEAIHRFWLSVVCNDEPGRTIFPSGASETAINDFVVLARKDMYNPKSPARLMQVKNTESGEIVSYGLWFFYEEAVGEKEEHTEPVTARESGLLEREHYAYERSTSDVNVEALRTFHEHGKRAREETMKGVGAYAYLATLVTNASHRHSGAATLLLQWGLNLADLHHLPTYVEATPSAQPLYLQNSFSPVSPLVIDLHPFGKPLTLTHSALLRRTPPVPLSPNVSLPVSISTLLTNADISAFSLIEYSAFTSSPLIDLIFPPPPPGSQVDDARAQGHLSLLNTDPTVRFVKAFLPTENHRIIGFARWSFLPAGQHPPEPHPQWAPAANRPLGEYYLSHESAVQKKLMRNKSYAFCYVCAVEPEWQRKGVGRRLLQWGLDEADKRGWQAYIDATPEGVGLYKKLGWKERERLVVDLRDWGWVGKEDDRWSVTVHLVREAKGRDKE